jgi:hypothetical protein
LRQDNIINKSRGENTDKRITQAPSKEKERVKEMKRLFMMVVAMLTLTMAHAEN